MQQPQKSRLELLQEWKEQRAAKQATGAGGQLPGRPPSAPKPGPGAPAAAPRAARPGEKENAVDPRPQVPAQPSAASLPAAAKAAPWDQHSRRPALPAGQRAHMEAQFGALEGRLQALQRESVKPTPGGDGPCAAAPPPYPDPAAAASSPPMPDAGAWAAAAAAGPMQAHAPAGRPPPIGSSAAAAAAAALAEPGRDGGTGLLAARLDALKRESVRPSFAGPQPQFEAAGGLDLHTLSRLANQLFNDEQFLQLCDKGMSSQLTRSKDGATEETKIMELAGGWVGTGPARGWAWAASARQKGMGRETGWHTAAGLCVARQAEGAASAGCLGQGAWAVPPLALQAILPPACLPAGMVKLLRRGMKELQNRTQQFIDHAVTFEKEAAQEVRQGGKCLGAAGLRQQLLWLARVAQHGVGVGGRPLVHACRAHPALSQGLADQQLLAGAGGVGQAVQRVGHPGHGGGAGSRAAGGGHCGRPPQERPGQLAGGWRAAVLCCPKAQSALANRMMAPK